MRTASAKARVALVASYGALAALALAVVGSPSAWALSRPTPLSPGDPMWSVFDDASSQYSIAGRSGRPNRPVVSLPIPPRKVPFDVTVGTDADDKPITLYSRCEVEPTETTRTGIPIWRNARACDIFSFRGRFGDLGEHRVESISQPGDSSEFMPVAVHGRVAYFQVGSPGMTPQLRLGNLIGGGSRPLPIGGGSRPPLPLPCASPSDGDAKDPTGIDFDGVHVATSWSFPTGEQGRLLLVLTDVNLNNTNVLASPQLTLERERDLGSPQLAHHNTVFYLRPWFGEPRGEARYFAANFADCSVRSVKLGKDVIAATWSDEKDQTFIVKAASLAAGQGEVGIDGPANVCAPSGQAAPSSCSVINLGRHIHERLQPPTFQNQAEKYLRCVSKAKTRKDLQRCLKLLQQSASLPVRARRRR